MGPTGGNGLMKRVFFLLVTICIFTLIIGIAAYWRSMPITGSGRKKKGKKSKKAPATTGHPGAAHSEAGAEEHEGGDKDGNPEEKLLGDIKALAKAIKLIDHQVEELGDKIIVEEEEEEESPQQAGGGGGGAAQGGGAVAVKRLNFPQSDDEGSTIFVSIASFRDVECAPMIQNLFEQAEKPQDVYVGVVEQHAPGDKPCLDPGYFANCAHNHFCPRDNIRSRHIQPREARGPTFGRYVSMLLYRGQRYLLMVDSHNRFIHHWDRALIGMHKSLEDPKAVLTHYPEAYTDGMDTNKEPQTTAYQCRANFFKEYLKFDAIVIGRSEKPRLQPFSAAGFMFAEAHILHNVPFDPHLPFLFDGEEVLYTIRMWTAGYNLFTPSYSVAYHFYTRKEAPKIWSEQGVNWQTAQTKSEERVQYILRSTYAGPERKRIVPDGTRDKDIIIDEEKYGLGSVRTLDEYYKFAGIDVGERKFNKDWCKLAQEQ